MSTAELSEAATGENNEGETPDGSSKSGGGGESSSGGGRASLMEAIRGAGGAGSLKPAAQRKVPETSPATNKTDATGKFSDKCLLVIIVIDYRLC